MDRASQARKNARAWQHAADAADAANEAAKWANERAKNAEQAAQRAWRHAYAGDEDGAEVWAQQARWELEQAEEQA